MKLISLTQGKFAQVDDEDYDFLIQSKWYAKYAKNSDSYYAVRGYFNGKNMSHIWMHRLILNVVESKILVDHKDHDTLNNQKSNLREATLHENALNRRSRKNSSSKYLGVSKDVYIRVNGVEKNKWKAVIQINNKYKHLGRFPFTPCGELLAAVIYDIAAENNHGQFANLNFKSLWPHI